MESKRVHLHVPPNVLLFLAAHHPASPLYFLHPVERPSVFAHSHLRRERAEERRGALPTACPSPNNAQHLHKWRQIAIPVVAKVSRMLQQLRRGKERIWWMILTIEVVRWITPKLKKTQHTAES